MRLERSRRCSLRFSLAIFRFDGKADEIAVVCRLEKHTSDNIEEVAMARDRDMARHATTPDFEAVAAEWVELIRDGALSLGVVFDESLAATAMKKIVFGEHGTGSWNFVHYSVPSSSATPRAARSTL